MVNRIGIDYLSSLNGTAPAQLNGTPAATPSDTLSGSKAATAAKGKPPAKRTTKGRAVYGMVFSGRLVDLLLNERGVLLYLIVKADRHGAVDAGYRLIEGATGIPMKSVKRAMQSLVKRGWIARLSVGKSKRDRTRWQLLTPGNRGHVLTHVDRGEQAGEQGSLIDPRPETPTGVMVNHEQGSRIDHAVLERCANSDACGVAFASDGRDAQ